MHQQTCQCTLLPAIVISCIVIPLYVYGNPVEKLNHFELQKHKNYKNDLNVAKSTNTDDPFLNHGRTIEKIELCRRGETVLVPVQNGLAMLPCRTKTAKVLHSSIRLYEGTPESPQANPIVLEQNDPSILSHTADGFLINVTDYNVTSFTCSVGPPKLEERNYVIFNLSMSANFIDVTCDCDCMDYVPGDVSYFTCRASRTAFHPKFKWVFRTLTGKYLPVPGYLDSTTYEQEIVLNRREVELPDIPISEVMCLIAEKNSSEWKINASVPLSINRDTFKPMVLDKYRSNKVEDTLGINLTCLFKSVSPAKIAWLRDNTPWFPSNSTYDVTHTIKNFTVISTRPLTFSKTNYTCVVTTAAGSDSKSFTVYRKENEIILVTTVGWRGFLYAAFPVVVTTLIAALLGAHIIRNYKRRERVRANLGDEVTGVDFGQCFLRIGEGKFGEVYRTNMGDVPVAVKAFKWPPSVNESEATFLFLDFLEEIRVMKKLAMSQEEGPKNIVRYLGYCAPSIRNFRVYLVLEFCNPGQLKSYLNAHADSNAIFNDIEDDTFLYDEQQEKFIEHWPMPILCTSHLMKWAEQIALAMRYVSEMQIVHRDLAGRNILLHITSTPMYSLDDMVALVGDFGMARVLQNEAYISPRVESNDPAYNKPRFIPIRWWAVEAMNLDNGNSLKGDVWSFGVLLWEMFNLCTKIPYSELDEFPHVDSDNNEFQLDLESYLSNPWNRLRRPTAMEVPEPIWDLMQRCWDGNPEARPNFREIHATLSSINEQYGLYLPREDAGQAYRMAQNSELPAHYCRAGLIP